MQKITFLPVFLLLLLLIKPAKAQKDSTFQSGVIESIEGIDELKYYRKVIDSCNKYIPQNFSVPVFKAKLFAYKAAALSEVHDSLAEARGMNDDSIVEDATLLHEIDSLYHQAAKVCASCDLIYIYKAYDYAGRYDAAKKEDRLLLEQNGFKEEKEGFWLSADFFSGKSRYAGLELSVALFQQGYRLQRIQGGKNKIFRTEYPYYASVFNLGFRKNLDRNGWAINFAPLTVGGYFVNARLLNLTYFRSTEGASFGLCPELGIRFWYLHAHAGYNFMFKSAMRTYEKWMFNFKIQVPIYTYN